MLELLIVAVLGGVLGSGIVHLLSASYRPYSPPPLYSPPSTSPVPMMPLPEIVTPTFPKDSSFQFRWLTGFASVGMDINPWFGKSMEYVKEHLSEAKEEYRKQFGGEFVLTI